MKKKILLSVLVVSVFVTAAIALNACKKNDNAVPTEVTVLRGVGNYAICAHCGKKLWDKIYYYDEINSVHYPIDSVFHIHEYQYGDTCALERYPNGYCRYNLKHHRHEVYYLVYPNGNDHYQDDWIHIGGGGW